MRRPLSRTKIICGLRQNPLCDRRCTGICFGCIAPELLKGLRQATQTNRVFGADHFQKQIEAAPAVRIAKRKPGPQGEAWDKQKSLA